MGSTWISPEMAHHLDFSPEKETKGVRALARREDGSPIRFDDGFSGDLECSGGRTGL